jgi:uncharacterized protein (DUF427 family)
VAGEGTPVRVETGAKRVRVVLGGVVVADTVRPLLVWEKPQYPAYYLPIADVRAHLLVPTGTTSRSSTRGDATHFTVKTATAERVDAAWRYESSPIEVLRDHVRFDWNAMDAWFEEDEEVFTHVRSPYTRVDILASSRPVRVEVGGVVIAESPRPHVLFETGLPPRWYLPKVDVRMELLVPSALVTHCPYKGRAEHFSVRLDDRVVENAAWSYATPLPESTKIAGLVSFYPDRVAVFVDEERLG